MSETALIQTIKLIPDGKMSACEKYIAYAGGKNQTLYLELFAYIWKYRSASDGEKVTIDALAQKFFGGRHQEVNVRSSQLKKIIEQFLVVSNTRMPKQELDLRGRIKLLEAAQSNYSLFLGYARALVRQLKKESPKLTESFNYLYQLYAGIFYHPKTDRFRGNLTYLQDASEQLDMYFAVSKLRLILENYHRKRIHPKIKPLAEEEPSLRLAAAYRSVPVIDLYLDLIEAYRSHSSVEQFMLLEQKYRACFDRLNDFDRKNAISKLIYLANLLYELGAAELLNEVLELYRFSDQKQLLLHQGKMSQINFVNIIVLALYFGDFDWAAGFRERYANYLAQDQRKICTELVDAYEAYYRGDYGSAAEQIVDIRANTGLHFFVDLRTRILQIWIQFEWLKRDAAKPDLINHSLDNFRKFIDYDNVLDGARKPPFKHLTKAMRDLVRLQLEPKGRKADQQLMKLKRFLQETDRIFARPWLYDQLKAF